MESVRQVTSSVLKAFKKERTPLGFCDGLDRPFIGFGDVEERLYRLPKYYTQYLPTQDFHKAACRGDTEAIKQLVGCSTSEMERLDQKNRTALHYACVYGQPEVVELLLKSHCAINSKDNTEATPLIKAAQCRQKECLALLLSHDADPNLRDFRQNTALHYAVHNGDLKIASCLLAYNTNIDAVNENKLTPLLLALKQHKEHMAELLINMGADIHATDFRGRTTLMYAVRCGSELIIRLLFQRGIDANRTDVYHWTAKRYAMKSKRNIAMILTEYEEKDLTNPNGKSENKENDACSMPNTELQESFQIERVEKADTEPLKSGSALEVLSEKQPKHPIKPEVRADDQPLMFERVFQTYVNHSSKSAEERDITKGRVLAWVEKKSPSKPPGKVQKHSSDAVKTTVVRPFTSDVCVEQVIYVSSDEDQEKDVKDEDTQPRIMKSDQGKSPQQPKKSEPALRVPSEKQHNKPIQPETSVGDQPLSVSETLSLPLEQREDMQSAEKKEWSKEEESPEGQRRCGNSGRVPSSSAQKEDVGHLSGPVNQRCENTATGETKDSPKKTLHLTPILKRKDLLPKRRLLRIYTRSCQSEPDLLVTPRERKMEKGSVSRQPVEKNEQRRAMETAVKPPNGHVAAGDAAAAAEASHTGLGPENGSIPRIKWEKAEKQPFPAPKRERHGLNKKLPQEKTKTMVTDDCQVSQSVSEDYDLSNCNPRVKRLIDQLQMQFEEIKERIKNMENKVSEMQKKLQETERIKNMENKVSEMQKKLQETEERLSWSEHKSAEQELVLFSLRLKQEQLQMKWTSFSNEKEAEKEEQHRKDEEKHRLEMCLKRQEKIDTELRRPRLDMDKLQKDQEQQTEAEGSAVMMEDHLQIIRSKQEIFQLKEIIKQKAEENQELQKKLSIKGGNLLQKDQEQQTEAEGSTMMMEDHLHIIRSKQEIFQLKEIIKQQAEENQELQKKLSIKGGNLTTAETQEPVDNTSRNHSASFFRPRELTVTNEPSELCEETTPHASARVVPKRREHRHGHRGDPTRSSSQGRLKSKERQSKVKEKHFQETGPNASAPSTRDPDPEAERAAPAAGSLHGRRRFSSRSVHTESLGELSTCQQLDGQLDQYLERSRTQTGIPLELHQKTPPPNPSSSGPAPECASASAAAASRSPLESWDNFVQSELLAGISTSHLCESVHNFVKMVSGAVIFLLGLILWTNIILT